MNLYLYRAELTHIVDGDTYDFEVDLGFHTSTKIRVRALDIDTHEIFGVNKDSDEYQQGMEEKRFVEEWFENADEIVLETEKDSKGSFGRWLARVYDGDPTRTDTECLNDLVREKFDVPYEG